MIVLQSPVCFGALPLTRYKREHSQNCWPLACPRAIKLSLLFLYDRTRHTRATLKSWEWAYGGGQPYLQQMCRYCVYVSAQMCVSVCVCTLSGLKCVAFGTVCPNKEGVFSILSLSLPLQRLFKRVWDSGAQGWTLSCFSQDVDRMGYFPSLFDSKSCWQWLACSFHAVLALSILTMTAPSSHLKP